MGELTWAEGNTICKNMGGTMATPKNRTEQDMVTSVQKSTVEKITTTLPTGCWIGMVCRDFNFEQKYYDCYWAVDGFEEVDWYAWDPDSPEEGAGYCIANTVYWMFDPTEEDRDWYNTGCDDELQ